MTLGLFGAAFLYADGMITPAISVLRAVVEGLRLAAPTLPRYWIIVISLAILLGLFKLQSRGTAKVGGLFGPIMLAWFGVLAALGAWHILQEPQVLAVLNPCMHAQLLSCGWHERFSDLGDGVLGRDGGRKCFTPTWATSCTTHSTLVVRDRLSVLLLNYFGQGEMLLLRNPAAMPTRCLKWRPSGPSIR